MQSKRSHFAVSKEVILEKNNVGIVNGPSDLITSAQNGAKSDTEIERCPSKKINMVKSRSHSSGSKAHKLVKSTVEVARDQIKYSGAENMGQTAEEVGGFQYNYSL